MNSVMRILGPVLGEDLASDIISYRNSRGCVKDFDVYRARITLNILMKSPDPKLAAWEYLNRDANSKNLSVEYLKACVNYDSDTGIFTRKLYRGHNSLPGTEINTVGSHGYIDTYLAGRLYLVHRLAWLYENGEWPEYIDHIDRNKLNNRILNLRACTPQENNWNLPKHPKNKSGVTGVTWDAKRRKWYASISLDGKTKSLGAHSDIGDAKKAYEDAVIENRGHFLGGRS